MAGWTSLLPKDDRQEFELFGNANTGINFNKYEDIPVDATGADVPDHINSVSGCFYFSHAVYSGIVLSGIRPFLYNAKTQDPFLEELVQ